MSSGKREELHQPDVEPRGANEDKNDLGTSHLTHPIDQDHLDSSHQGESGAQGEEEMLEGAELQKISKADSPGQLPMFG